MVFLFLAENGRIDGDGGERMEIKSLKCPNCGSALDKTDELDVYFCEHCHIKMQITGLDKEFYKERIKTKEFEHEERLKEKEAELEILRLQLQEKQRRREAFQKFAHSTSGELILTFGGLILISIIAFSFVALLR